VSPALGAFVAGLLLAETPFATQIRADVGSLKALFVALFFVGVGMLARLEWFARYAAIVPAAIAAILLVKAILIVLVLRLLRVPLRHAVATGVALCQVGEFGFVLLQVSGRFELLPGAVSEVLLLAVFGSLLLTPLLLPLGYPLGVRIERRARGRGASAPEAARAPEDGPGPRDRVIVVGYGPVGQGVAGSVRLSGLPVLVVDANPRVLDLARESDLPAMVGDATYAEILHHARLKEARALIVTVPDHPTALAVLRLARSIAPDVPVVVRARYHRFADEFAREGATQVYDEEGSAGESMAALVQTCLRGVCGR
jgi:CPA2 family monovalent cation:H+ antiporter-2